MWRFSEAFMEDCIAEAPTAFLDEHLNVVARQQDLNGFRPDLILQDRSGRQVIVEIQQKALDRYHLYKCLEYRDLVATTLGGSVPRVCLVCESIDEKYHQTIRTHGIELFVISRERFIGLAIENCAAIVAKALSADTNVLPPSLNDLEIPRAQKFRFEPLDWYDSCSPVRWLSDLKAQFHKHAARIEDISREYYHQIYYDIDHFLDEGVIRVLQEMVDLSKWDLKKIQDRVAASTFSHSIGKNESPWKPRIELIPFITSKDNLSVIWRPTGSAFLGFSDGDWLRYPDDSTYGWSRPANELMFIRSVRYLDPLENDDWDDRVNWDVLSELFIGLVRAAFDYLVQCLRCIFTVTLINDFEFDTREEQYENGRRTRITGWRIYNLEDRRRSEIDAWFSNFERNFGISMEKFLKVYRAAVNEPRRASHNFAKNFSKDLATQGIQLSPGKITSMITMIREERPYLLGDGKTDRE